MGTRAATLLLTGALVVACATDNHLAIVTGPRIPSSSSAPEVAKVQDLGSPRLAGLKQIPTQGGDGVAVVGELVLVTGSGFGRQPRVSVGGRAAEQLARTADGGVVIRVPWGVRPGSRAFEVKNTHGKSARSYPVRRYALATVPSHDRVHVLEVDRQGAKLAGAGLPLPSARLIRYCADGQIAYISGRSPEGKLTVTTVDMVAPGGPRTGEVETLPGEQVIALTAADRVPLAAAMSQTHIRFFDTRDPKNPASYPPQPLPEALADHLVAAAINPEGTLLAALVDTDNQVILYDMARPRRMSVLAKARVLPSATAPLLQDLRFSADSRTLWIVSGDNPRSRGRGSFPLRLTGLKIKVERSGRAKRYGILSVWRSLDVPHQAAPVALTVARGQPTAGGATVQVPPDNAAIFVTARDSKLLRLANTRMDRERGLRRAVRILQEASPLGTLLRTNIQGAGGPMFSSSALLGSLDISSDSQVLLVAGARVGTQRKPATVSLVYGITFCRVFGEEKRRFIELAEVDPESLSRPFMLGDVRIQP